MKNLKLFIEATLIYITLTTYAYGTEENLCTTNETMIASCNLNEPKHRIISFCHSNDKKTVLYRFGVKSKHEFEYTFSSKTPLYRWLDKWTYTTYFGFRTAGHAYIFGVPQEKYGAKAFLEVNKNDTTIMERDCTQNSFGEKTLMSEAISDVDDKAVREGGLLFPPN